MTNFLLFLVVMMAAIFGYKLKTLTKSGAIAAVVVGFAILLAFGVQGFILMGTFFVTASFWSKFKVEKKFSFEDKINKSGARDAVQVFANGGMPAILSLLYLCFHEEILLYMFICSLAVANSDTWASEIGSLSSRKPIHVLTWQKVDAGTSGAMSLLGTIAALLGSMLIGMMSHFLMHEVSLQVAMIIGFVGFIGNIIDTILGATVQVTYVCPNCGLITEKTRHCQEKTAFHSGLRIFNNDMVNFLSIAFGSLFILLLL